MARRARGVRVDFERFTHPPLESLFPEMPYFTTLIVRLHLEAVGTWVREHIEGVRLHPVVDVLAWDLSLEKRNKHRCQGPKEGLMLKAGFEEWGDLCQAACNMATWRGVVKEACIREETMVARETGERRCEEARTPKWKSADTSALCRQRQTLVEAWLKKRDQEQR